jgi:hypothetical protein
MLTGTLACENFLVRESMHGIRISVGTHEHAKEVAAFVCSHLILCKHGFPVVKKSLTDAVHDGASLLDTHVPFEWLKLVSALSLQPIKEPCTYQIAQDREKGHQIFQPSSRARETKNSLECLRKFVWFLRGGRECIEGVAETSKPYDVKCSSRQVGCDVDLRLTGSSNVAYEYVLKLRRRQSVYTYHCTETCTSFATFRNTPESSRSWLFPKAGFSARRCRR